MRSSLRGLGAAALRIAVTFVAGSILLPLVPAWPFVLFAHFRMQYLVAGLVVVAAAGALRLRGWFDVALIATLVNALWIVPDLSRGARELPADGHALRVLVLNVHTSSSSFGEVAALVRDVDADVVGLLEVDERWLAGVGSAVAAYPHRIEEPRDDNFGIALYSRLPVRGAAEELGSRLPTIVATIDVHGTAVPFVLTHPIPPVSASLLASQLEQLDAIAARVRSFAGPVVLAGDLNATPWSRPFRDLRAATGLCDTRAGFGYQGRFPASSLVLRIPIDHVLVSCSIGVRRRVIERGVGSDHLPVLIDLVIPR